MAISRVSKNELPKCIHYSAPIVFQILNKGSYMSAHVLLNLLNEFGKRDKMRGLPSILSFFCKTLINSIIQERER